MVKRKPTPDIAASRAADDLSIQKIRGGDGAGRAELYEKYRPVLRWYLPQFMESKGFFITEEDVDDRVSEALIKLFDAIKSGQYDPNRGPIWPYLKRIGEHECLNYWRKNYGREVHFPTARTLASAEEFVAKGLGPNDQIPFDMLPEPLYDTYFGEPTQRQHDFYDRSITLPTNGHHVDDFLAQLRQRDFCLFTLVYLQGKKVEGIAEKINIPAGTLRSIMSRAKAKYRKKIGLK
jgi:RNA polymerase sigma factor (sigma-70 family)